VYIGRGNLRTDEWTGAMPLCTIRHCYADHAKNAKKCVFLFLNVRLWKLNPVYTVHTLLIKTIVLLTRPSVVVTTVVRRRCVRKCKTSFVFPELITLNACGCPASPYFLFAATRSFRYGSLNDGDTFWFRRRANVIECTYTTVRPITPRLCGVAYCT